MSLANKLSEERRARLAAERLLELKQAELTAANRKLGRHALALTRKIGQTKAEFETVLDENERVKSDLSAAHAKIEVAERRLWHSIQTIQDGFAFFDCDNRMIGANNAYLIPFDGLEEIAPGVSYMRILQLATDEGIVDTQDMHPDDWRAMMSERWLAAAPNPIIIRLWNGRHVQLTDQRGPDGDVISLAMDITQTVRHQAEMAAARAKAESANRAKSAFLANMSHEIRTPMNGVLGMAELLNDTSMSEEQKLYVDTIRNSAEALLVIINDVLDYSKIEADKLTLHPEPFDLERCIHEVVTLLQPTARDKGLAMLVDYDLFLPTRFVGDPGRVRQVLTNLVGNAVKFTSEGHVLIRVTGLPDAGNKTSAIHVAIEDTGIGIPEDKRDLIFGEFNQVEDDRNRKFEGTGLGLAISRRLVAMMGGEVWVDSEVGKGSCFGFRLSMPRADTDQVSIPRFPDDRCDVVIVDPQDTNRAILTKQLELLGGRVRGCDTPLAALSIITPDTNLVLSAHTMRDMDGLELAEALRNREWEGAMLILSDTPGLARNDPASGCVQAILQTPVSRNDLFQQLEALSISTVEDEIEPSGTVGESGDAPLRTDQEHEAPTLDDNAETPVVLRPMRILAAEDNRTNRLVFSKMVKDLPIELQFAQNGQEAVAAHAEFAPDLIFMDISMPIMDGKEATRAIRKAEEETGKHTPIVALTAHAMSGDADGILAAGLDHYLTKPLKKSAIHAKIADLCPDGARCPVEEEAQE